MFKKISVFLVLVLVITTLSACAGSEGSNAELTKEKRKEISRAWGKKCYPIDWNATSGQSGALRYYGTFAGHDVFRLFPRHHGNLPEWRVHRSGRIVQKLRYQS